MDPYLPVRTVEVLAENEIPTGLLRPEIQVDGIWKPIEKVSFSTSYNLLTNERVREIGDRFANRNNYTRVKEYFNGKRFTLAYMSDVVKEETESGTIRPGIMFQNSYDKSHAFRVQALALVEVCKNGMTSNKWFDFHKFKHNGNLDENLEKMEEEMDHVASINGDTNDRFREFCNAMLPVSKMGVTKNNLSKLRNSTPYLTANNFGKIMDLYLKRNNDSMWELLNAGTEHYWHNQSNLDSNRLWVDAFIGLAANA